MDDLSNRDLPQVPDEELTPAERRELERCLDAFVAMMRDKIFTRDPAHRAKTVRKWGPLGQGGEC